MISPWLALWPCLNRVHIVPNMEHDPVNFNLATPQIVSDTLQGWYGTTGWKEIKLVVTGRHDTGKTTMICNMLRLPLEEDTPQYGVRLYTAMAQGDVEVKLINTPGFDRPEIRIYHTSWDAGEDGEKLTCCSTVFTFYPILKLMKQTCVIFIDKIQKGTGRSKRN